MKVTANDLTQSEGVDYQDAAGLLRFLSKKNLIQKVGKRPAKGGKGKPSDEFELPESLTLTFVQAVVETPAENPVPTSEVTIPAVEAERVEVAETVAV